jgi:phosphoglycolate phosphatase/AHBA synthesis associated protein
VLFDLDGVLVDSYEVWFHLVRAAAAHFRGPEVTRSAFAAGWGQGIGSDLERWFPGRTVADVERYYTTHFLDHAAHLRVDPDAHAVLTTLRTARLRTALVTNTPSPLARAILERVRLGLDAVVGGTDVPNAKPAPDIVLAAARRLGVPLAESVMVGDTDFDRAAARAAGVRFAGLRTEGDPTLGALRELLELPGLLRRPS